MFVVSAFHTINLPQEGQKGLAPLSRCNNFCSSDFGGRPQDRYRSVMLTRQVRTYEDAVLSVSEFSNEDNIDQAATLSAFYNLLNNVFSAVLLVCEEAELP
eukprot:IDg13833t1